MEPAGGGGHRSWCKPPHTDRNTEEKTKDRISNSTEKGKGPREGPDNQERTDAKLQRRPVSATRVAPAGAGSGRRGRGAGDGRTSPPRFLRQTVRSSWVNQVNPPLIQTHDSMSVFLINWKTAPPLWSAHTRKKIKKKQTTNRKCLLSFSFNRRLLIMSKTQSELSCESSASLQGRNGVLLMQSMILNHSAAEFMTAECQVKS